MCQLTVGIVVRFVLKVMETCGMSELLDVVVTVFTVIRATQKK